METIGAARFKTHCLGILDELKPEGLVITKRGKPVARVIPWPEKPSSLIGALKGKIEVQGDILSTGVQWNADD